MRMKDDRIPKALLYGRLTTGLPRQGNHNTYLNCVKSTLRACGINGADIERLASERNDWRATHKTGIAKAEDDRINCLIAKRMRRKANAGLVRQST